MIPDDKTPAVACEGFEEDLVLYYYGELAASERATVANHVRSCQHCQSYLKEMESILPLAVKRDEPPQAFWDDYSRELRHKLTAARTGRPWWRGLISFLEPWTIPVYATAAVADLAITLTIGKGFWSSTEIPQEDETFMEILPASENLDFFKTMEVLDAMDVLENMGAPAKGSA
ncbi:MAG: zf-HC2 domain-containing protein [Candidatus Binatia bacterium]